MIQLWTYEIMEAKKILIIFSFKIFKIIFGFLKINQIILLEIIKFWPIYESYLWELINFKFVKTNM